MNLRWSPTRKSLWKSGKMAALAAILLLAGAACRPRRNEEEARLNLVLILADDLGWTDSGAYGSKFYETPHLDRLARDGMRFTESYTAGCVCSPTRASILSGKYPARLNITDWIPGGRGGRLLPPSFEQRLPLEEWTLGEAFQKNGYRTGYIGKWHLGDRSHFPDRQGFAWSRAVAEGGFPATYFYPYRGVQPSRQDVPDLEDGVEGEYLTDRLTDEAISFLGRPDPRPFFLFLSHYAVHVPLEARARLVDKYREKRSQLSDPGGPALVQEGEAARTRTVQNHPTYAAMIESLDESVGRLRSALQELGLEQRTALILLSDNGGLSTLARNTTSIPEAPTSNRPLRAGKGWLYEGGIRVPLIVTWPGVIQGGSRCDEPVISTDLFPTLLEMVGLDPSPDQHLDGISLTPLLTGRGPLERPALFWHYPHYLAGNTPSAAVRAGDYKLIEWFEEDRAELYNLSTDLGEADNLARKMPELTEQLRERLHAWQGQVGARMPVLNPDWTPER